MLVLGTSAWISRAADTETPAPAKVLVRGPRFQRPGFPDLDDFVQTVQAREHPWRELLEPDKNSDYNEPEEVVAPGAWEIKTIHSSRRQAIVFVRYKANRRAPFSAVVFLLSKTGHRWHVNDFIRRSVSFGSYSDVRVPKLLRFHPSGHLHFYFTEHLGGRKLGTDADEFYMVDANRLHRTLFLRNDGAYIGPADPWLEFGQDATVSVVNGRLQVRVQRTWRLQSEEERKQTFVVTFRWDSRRKKFASRQANTLSLPEPSAWTAEGLPSPPAE